MSSIQDRINAMKKGESSAKKTESTALNNAPQAQSIQDRLAKARSDGLKQTGKPASTTPAKEYDLSGEAWTRATPSQTKIPSKETDTQEKQGFLSRAANTIKSSLLRETSNLTNFLGTRSDVGGATAMGGVYKDQADMLQRQIESAQNLLKDSSISDQDRKELEQEISEWQRQLGIYGNAVRSNEETGKALYQVSDEAALASQDSLNRAKDGLGTVGKATVDVGSVLSSYAIQGLLNKASFGTLGYLERAASFGGQNSAEYRRTVENQNANSVASGEEPNAVYDPKKASMLQTGAASGIAVGSALSRGVGQASLNLMRARGIQNYILPNIIKGGVESTGYMLGETGMAELSKALTYDDYEPDWNAIGTQALISFGFGAITSTIRAVSATRQNKAYINSLNEMVKDRYQTVQDIMQYGTPEQKATGAASVMDGVAELRNAINNLQVVGAQKEVDAINRFLNSIDAEMAQYLPNVTEAAGTLTVPSSTLPPTVTNAPVSPDVPSPVQPSGPAAPPVMPTTPPVTPAQTPPASPSSGSVSEQLIAAGATAEEAEKLAPAIESVLNGEEISGNQAGAIARNDAAVSVLETVTGEQIETDAPLGEVKESIKALASRQEVQEEATAPVDTPVETTPVDAPQIAPAAPADTNTQSTGNLSIIQDFAKDVDKAGSSALTSMYTEGQDPENYIAGMMKAYGAGKNGGDAIPTAILSDMYSLAAPQAEAAYLAGQADAGVSPVAEQAKENYTGISRNEEGFSYGESEVYLRESSQRADGANPGGSVRQLEESTGRDQGWKATVEPADREAASLSYGRKVSSFELGISGGFENDSVYLVTGGSTAATRSAQAEADKRGLKLVLFGGGDIHAAGAPDGANGYVDETTMYVRVDDPEFTADQLSRHEGGHDKIRKGEVDISEVRRRIEKIVGGKAMLDTAAELYSWAYEGSNLTPEQIWEETICDSLGNMNIFAGALDNLDDFVTNLHETVKSAVEESARAPRGPPTTVEGEEKYSQVFRGKLYGRERNGEARRTAFQANRVLHWTKTSEGRREAVERRVQFLARMGQSGATVRSRDGYSWAYLGVANHRAGEYAKQAAKELRKLGTNGFFIYDGEIQWNYAGKTYGSNSYAVTMADGSIGINNNTELTDDAAPPAELAAHETIHRKVNAKTKEGLAYRKAVIANSKVTHPMFRRYFHLINYGYHEGKLNFNNAVDRAEFFREFAAFVGGFSYAGNVDVSPMFEDYGEVRAALEKVLGVEVRHGGSYSRRLNLDNLKGKADEVAELLENYHDELNKEYRELEKQERLFKEAPEYKLFMDTISKSSVDSESIDKAVEAYSAWEKSSGYGQIVKSMEDLRGELRTVYGRLQRVKEQAAKEAQEEYRALYNEEFSKKYASKAARKFGTTSRFDLAGYLTVNGSLLDFSDRQGYRVQDHREISEVLDFLPEEHGYSDGLIEFMNMGNIRMQSYGIDISQPPNAKQIPVLRRFFSYLDGEVTVDFSRENGDNAGSIDYEEGTRPDKILRDIDYFFKNGEVPDQSDVSRFHGMYSRRLSLDSEEAQKRFAPEFYSKMERAVEAIKGNKIGAASVVPYLTGRGIKAEEIKWSGISAFLEGRKSVGRDDILEYIKQNRFEIKEEVLQDDNGGVLPYTDEEHEKLNFWGEQQSDMIDKAVSLWEEAYGEELPESVYMSDDLGAAISREVIDRNGGTRYFAGISELKEMERKLLSIADEYRRIDTLVSDMRDRVSARAKNTSKTKWSQYKLDGGDRYREYKYKLPGSDYTNQAMQTHWNDKGVLAHARVQDFEHNGEPVMFIEEIQSDWHNAGAKNGYGKKVLYGRDNTRLDFQTSTYSLYNDSGELLGVDIGRRSEYDAIYDKLLANANKKQQENYVPDAPYSKTYHEYVLKSLLRKAAEGGYSYLAWTPGWLQEERWSDAYAEGYRIEYDQNIPKFLNKYGKQWGARTEDISLDGLRNITVHAIHITDEMRGSVLYEGQPKFSRKVVSFDDLREENRLLKGRLDELKGVEKQAASKAKQAEYWKGQTKRTTQPTLRQEDVDKLAKRLIRDYDGTVSAKDISAELKALGEFIMRGGDGKNELTWTEVKDRAVSIARNIVESAQALADDGEAEIYREIRSLLRKQRIAFNDQGDIADYGDFRKRNMGKFILAKDGLPIDVLWGELNSTYGEGYFPSDITHPADQLVHLAELLDDLRPVYENPHSRYMAEAVEYLANDIVDSLIDESVRQTPPTFADRQAAKLSEQKAKDAQRLSDLREQKNTKIKEIRQRGVEKTKEAVQRARDDRDRKLSALKRHYQQKEARGRDSRKATALRQKIQKHTKELSKDLLKPTDKHHVPEALRGPVARLLEAINLESNYELEFGKDAKYHRVKPGESLYAEVTKRTQAAADLKAAYAKIGGNLVLDPSLLGVDGEAGWLDEVISMAGKPIADMNSKELETVWQAIKAVENSIRTANKAFSAGRFRTISEAAAALLAENREKAAPGENPKISKAQNLLRLDMLTPEAYFHRLGNVGDALFRSMRNAQDQHIRIMKQVSDFTHDLLKDVNVRKLERTLHTVELGEEEVTLSTAQLMELHALIRRGEQAINHILVGGILPEARAGKENGKRRNLSSSNVPIRGITWEQLVNAESLLSPEEIAIADALQDYLSGPMSEHGNKASMEVYNYKKFTEEHYWPIRSNSQDIRKQDAAASSNVVTSPANYGMTKATKPKSDTSLRLGSLFDTFSTHTSQMATYSAWLGVTEDLNRIRNFMFRNEDGFRTGGVQEILDRVHGRGGSDYLQKLLSDISIGVKGRHAETNYGGALIGNFKAAAVGANLRVIAQQPTAILRAMEMINPKYLLAGNLHPFAGWKKARKYAPIAQWKDWGYFDIHTGRQMKDVLFETDSPMDKARNFTMAGASLADSYAWGILWNACEMETRDKQRDLAVGSAEYYKAVAERFTQIIDHTQVVDGIMQRSQIMRSNNELTKMATSFMAEPTKQYNELMSAIYDYRNANGKDTKKEAGGRLARTMITLFITAMVNAAVQSLVDALRNNDKERGYWERFWDAYIGFGESGFTAKSFIDGNLPNALNPIAMIPFAKDIFSAINGYEVTRMDFELISDMTDAGKNLVKALNGSGKMTLQAAAANFAMVAAKMMGISVSNFKRDALAIANEIMAATGSYELRYRMLKETRNFNYPSNATEVMNLLYEAMCNDEEAYQIIKRDLVARDALKTETTSTAQRIKDNMRQKYTKAKKAGKAPSVSQKILDEIGVTAAYAPKKEEDKFTEEDLSATQYERYNSQRASIYRSVVDEISGYSGWNEIDGETKDKAISAATTYAKETALAANSNGRYEVETKWVYWATGGKSYQVDEADAIFFKVLYDSIPGDEKNGKTVSGSKKKNVLSAAEEYMPHLSDTALEYLSAFYWTPNDRGLKQLKENGWK